MNGAVPLFAVTVMAPLFASLHVTSVLLVVNETVSTVTVAALELASGQLPLLTTARN
jgi:hypothetical protein